MAPISLSSELEPGFRVHARLGHGPSTFVGHEFGFKEAQPQSAPRQPYLHEKIPDMGPLMLGRIKVTHQPIHSYLFFFSFPSFYRVSCLQISQDMQML